MPGGLKFGVVLLTLGCFASAEERAPAPLFSDAELLRFAAERDRQSMEDAVRLSVYHECGGDSELRCQQLAPRNLRGIAPTVPLRALECKQTVGYPRRVRDCAFALGDEGGPSTECRVTLRESAGYHSLYWSDEAPSPPEPPSTASTSSIQVPGGTSSLACAKPLLALTREPERVDPAPAKPPRAITGLAALVTPDDYPIPAISKGQSGIVAMRLQIGSHGRIDRCTVIRSSVSDDLDRTACELLRARAHFFPATDAAGRAVAAEISHSHKWEAPR